MEVTVGEPRKVTDSSRIPAGVTIFYTITTKVRAVLRSNCPGLAAHAPLRLRGPSAAAAAAA